MLNEEKVILMTKLASYEKRQISKYRNIDSYFRGDYIVLEVMKSVFAGTVAFCICLGLYLLYNSEEFMANIYEMDYMGVVKTVLIYYGITIGVFVILTYILSAWRFRTAKKSLKNFYSNLKKLSAFYGDNKS